MEQLIYESLEPAPLRSEVEWALNHLRKGKSPGPTTFQSRCGKQMEKKELHCYGKYARWYGK